MLEMWIRRRIFSRRTNQTQACRYILTADQSQKGRENIPHTIEREGSHEVHHVEGGPALQLRVGEHHPQEGVREVQQRPAPPTPGASGRRRKGRGPVGAQVLAVGQCGSGLLERAHLHHCEVGLRGGFGLPRLQNGRELQYKRLHSVNS
eukprot:9472479-Pyramimonas_sp.AAC.3